MKTLNGLTVAVMVSAGMMATPAFAGKPVPESYTSICNTMGYGEFVDAIKEAYLDTNQFGFALPMWATLMDHTGKVCYVYSVKGGGVDNGGADAGNNAWLGSRVISAQKANTANAFSLDGLAISTGAISATVYPGGSLYGLQHSNPVDTEIAYEGSAERFGTDGDPMEGERVGGVNVFGGGVALYNEAGVKVGAVGGSGDTSCRDHTFAWRIRYELGLDNQPNDDGLVLGVPAALYEQPACGVNDPTPTAVQGTQEFLATGSVTGPFGGEGDYGIRSAYVAP